MSQTSLFIMGLVIIAALSWVALRTWQKVWQAEKQQAEQEAQYQQEAAANEQKRLDHIHESVNTICSALLAKQVDIPEASIRLAVLLGNLPLTCESKHHFAPIFEFYNKSQHIPTHERWKALTKAERRAFTHELTSLENELGDSIMTLAREIQQNPFGGEQAKPTKNLHLAYEATH